MLLFQHNNLKANEWLGIRRELAHALRKVDDSRQAAGQSDADLASEIKIHIIQTRIFEAALKVVEYYNPEDMPGPSTVHPSDPMTQTSTPVVDTTGSPDDPSFTHGLSRTARNAAASSKEKHPLTPLMSGPLALVTFPTVSPQHLKTAISILSPSPPNFPAPSRRANPGYHDPTVYNGLQKLLLMGARVEGKVFDMEGTKWVGGIDGGLEGLRGQLVAMLQGFGSGLTNTLEGASRSLYLTVEGRRTMLEEEEKGTDKKED